MDETERSDPLEGSDAEVRELLGLFDVPAFARRGQDLDHGLARLHDRCRLQREAMLDMVWVRLRQWAGAVTGPDSWPVAFHAPIDPLWPLTGAEPPRWGVTPAPARRQRAIARDLVASVERFNRRWTRYLDDLPLDFLNRSIDDFNHYYLLEKECVMRSARLAARHFRPRDRLGPGTLLEAYPALPVPGLRG